MDILTTSFNHYLQAGPRILKYWHWYGFPRVQEKGTSRKIFYCTWKTFFAWCELSHFDSKLLCALHFGLLTIENLLEFGLSYSQEADFGLVSIIPKTSDNFFIQGISQIRPPLGHIVLPWELNVVLSALKKLLFKFIRELPLDDLPCKVTFLVAIMSVKHIYELTALF